jgi:dTDP-glucose pyrophosphorylase
MNVVIPMAGRGQRFVVAGYPDPKPLIDVLGRPMYSWATDCVPLDGATRLVFVVLREHLDRYPLGDDIKSRYAAHSPVVVPLDGVTDGQLCTVLEAADELDPDAPLVIYNADTTFESPTIAANLARLGSGFDGSLDGLLGVFEAPGDHWSFARLDDDGRVVETAEKVRISPYATTGLYAFGTARAFVDAGRAMVADDDRTRGEFYVAPLYNRLIAGGAVVEVDHATTVEALGTPDELRAFLAARR